VLDRLIDQQHGDGGWPVDFSNYLSAATLEWHGHMTVHALSILKHNSTD
jgi:hypothetical protein